MYFNGREYNATSMSIYNISIFLAMDNDIELVCILYLTFFTNKGITNGIQTELLL